jgi:lipopolysaccharide transport system permease protein
MLLRDIRTNNHATRLGVFWVIVQPFLMISILILVMGYLVRVPSGSLPYPLVVISGYMVWGYFSGGILKASTSIQANAYLINKVFFPRIIVPLVPIVSGLIELGVFTFIFILTSLYYEFKPNQSWLYLLWVLPTLVMITMGFGLIVSALTSRYKDLGNFLPILVQIGVYICPIFYLTSLVPEKFIWLYKLNPLVELIDVLRSALLGGTIELTGLLYPSSFAAILMIFGVYYFYAAENSIVDRI